MTFRRTLLEWQFRCSRPLSLPFSRLMFHFCSYTLLWPHLLSEIMGELLATAANNGSVGRSLVRQGRRNHLVRMGYVPTIFVWVFFLLCLEGFSSNTAKWIGDRSIFSSIKPKHDNRLFVDFCSFASSYLKFTSSNHKIVQQFYDSSGWILVRAGKYTKIKKQSLIKENMNPSNFHLAVKWPREKSFL